MCENEICAKPISTDQRSSVSSDSYQTKYSLSDLPLTKVVMINSYEKLVFARYNSYTMIPGFTISNLLNNLDEDKIKRFVS